MTGGGGNNSFGGGPVTVDGNPATLINIAYTINSGSDEVYAYSVSAAGNHTIICSETGNSKPWYLNFAAAFYLTPAACTPLSIANIITRKDTIPHLTGGKITDTITTTVHNAMIYSNFENNNGQTGPFVDTWTGAKKLEQLHEGNGDRKSTRLNSSH